MSTFDYPEYRMSPTGKVMAAASLICLLAGEVIVAHLTLLGCLVLSIIALTFFVVCIFSLGCAFKEWRRRHWRALIPLAACVFVVLIFQPLGGLIRHVVFVWSLPSYEMVVKQMEAGSIPVPDLPKDFPSERWVKTATFGRIPEAETEARLVYVVFAEKTTNGVLMVEFDTEGCAMGHLGYLYSSSGVIEPGSMMDSRWPGRGQVRSKWFHVSN